MYPDAKEIASTGIWDTPYTYDKTGRSAFPFVDSSPLVNPVADAGAPEINEKLTPTPTTSTVENKPEPLPTTILIISTSTCDNGGHRFTDLL